MYEIICLNPKPQILNPKQDSNWTSAANVEWVGDETDTNDFDNPSLFQVSGLRVEGLELRVEG